MKCVEEIKMTNNKLCAFLLSCLLLSGCISSGNKKYQNNQRPSALIAQSAVSVASQTETVAEVPVASSAALATEPQLPKKEELIVKKMGQKKLEFEHGFKKMKWGDRPSAKLKRIEQDTHDKELTAYSLEGKQLHVFGLQSGMIIYYFKNNRFFRLEILWQPNEPEYQILKSEIIEEWGDADEVTVLGSYRWEKPGQHLSVLLSNVNANRANSEEYLMSLVVEKSDT